MAVAGVLARTRRCEEALRWYDDALRLAPAERDAVVGRARILVRARRTGAAIAVYERWLADHPMDAEAGRELAAARVAAAPAVTPLVSGSRDSDGNTTLRLGGAAELAASGPTRLGVAASRERVQDGVTATGLEELTLRAASRPRPALQLDAAAGATRLDGSDGHGVSVIPTAQVRARWRAPLAGPAVDLRAARSAGRGAGRCASTRSSSCRSHRGVTSSLSWIARIQRSPRPRRPHVGATSRWGCRCAGPCPRPSPCRQAASAPPHIAALRELGSSQLTNTKPPGASSLARPVRAVSGAQRRRDS